MDRRKQNHSSNYQNLVETYQYFAKKLHLYKKIRYIIKHTITTFLLIMSLRRSQLKNKDTTDFLEEFIGRELSLLEVFLFSPDVIKNRNLSLSEESQQIKKFIVKLNS